MTLSSSLAPPPPQYLSRSTAVEIVNSSKVLQAETRMLLDGKLLVSSAPDPAAKGAGASARLCSLHRRTPRRRRSWA